MARTRYLKPEFFDDEALASTPAYARLLFAGLWTRADRCGRLRDEPGRLRAQLFPYEPSVDVNALLNELQAVHCVIRYEHEGVRYLAVRQFLKHQKPHHREADSTIPPPTDAQIKASRTLQHAPSPGQPTTSPEPASTQHAPSPGFKESGGNHQGLGLAPTQPRTGPHLAAQNGNGNVNGGRAAATPTVIPRAQAREWGVAVDREHDKCADGLCRHRGSLIARCMLGTQLMELARCLTGAPIEKALEVVRTWALTDRPPVGWVAPPDKFRYWNDRWAAAPPRSSAPATEDRRADYHFEMLKRLEAAAE